MRPFHVTLWKPAFVWFFIVCTALSQGFGQSLQDLLNPPIVKLYMMKCTYVSLDPNRPMETYKSHGGGTLSAGATLGGSWEDELRSFQTTIYSGLKKERFWLRVEVKPNKHDKITERQTLNVDLSDLRAQSIEVARNDDGRIYFINMTPSINIVNRKAKRLQASAFNLERWHLSGCPIVLNSEAYAGNHGCNGGPIAWFEYPTVGRVDFSLVPFKGAEPSGVLFDGHIQLRHDDLSVDIYGVENGQPPVRLPEGPYKVWASWSPPTETAMEPPKELPASLEEFKAMVKAEFARTGQTPPSDEELEAGYERAKTMDPKQLHTMALSSGVRGISKKERLE